MRRKLLPLLTLLAALTVGCSAAATPSPTSSSAEAPVPEEAQALVRQAKEHLAQKLGIGVESIVAVQVAEVQWRDSSLGCPEPGKMYAQVITPGYKVLLQVGGETHEYHTDKARHVVACEKGQE